MSARHPIIAITGSSGAGTTTVKSTFEKIFQREGVTAAFIEGDAFHKYDRAGMKAKVAATAGSQDVKHLLWLRERLGDRLMDAVVVTTGRVAYRRPDGVAVVPAALLGP